MTDRARIAALEGRLVNAWPSFEVEYAEGWLLRFAEGYSKRANAASPLLPGARLDAELIRAALEAFDARGIDPCFRLTGIEDPDAADALEAAGFVPFDPSLGMEAPLGPDLVRDAAVRLSPAPKPAWIAAAAAAYGGEKSNRDILGRILRLIRRPAVFATLSLDGEDSAWGFAVYERGFVGLYDIVVAPELRGLGLGRRLVTTLMAWGAGAGAARAYLQTREANTVAQALYGSLGFQTAYRYTHRVRPDRARTVATAAPAAISTAASPSDRLGSP